MEHFRRFTPAQRAALHALDEFGACTAPEASVLLDLWCRRPELSDAEVAAVVGWYPKLSRVRWFTQGECQQFLSVMESPCPWNLEDLNGHEEP